VCTGYKVTFPCFDRDFISAPGNELPLYLLQGEYRVPPLAEMEADIRRGQEKLRARYVASKRHTMQVDFDSYLHELSRARRAGARRTRAAGYALSVPSRAPLAPAGR
jgi:hypothetical protein